MSSGSRLLLPLSAQDIRGEHDLSDLFLRKKVQMCMFMHCITTRTSELTSWHADRAPLQTKVTSRRSHTRKRRRSDAWEAMRDQCPRRRGAAQNGTAHAAVSGACVLPEPQRSRRCRGGGKAQQLIEFGPGTTLLRPWRPLAASQVLGRWVKPQQLASTARLVSRTWSNIHKPYGRRLEQDLA